MFVFFVRLEVEDWRVRHSARQGAVLLEPTASLYINFEPLSTLMAIPSLSLDHGKSDDANFKAHDIDREIYDDDASFMASFRVSWSVLGWAKYTR